jgi:hypothetical protein
VDIDLAPFLVGTGSVRASDIESPGHTTYEEAGPREVLREVGKERGFIESEEHRLRFLSPIGPPDEHRRPPIEETSFTGGSSSGHDQLDVCRWNVGG